MIDVLFGLSVAAFLWGVGYLAISDDKTLPTAQRFAAVRNGLILVALGAAGTLGTGWWIFA